MAEDQLEKTVKELQKKIDDDEKQMYSPVVIREYLNPTNFGILEHPDAVGVIKGLCGDTMKMTLKIQNGTIQDARFWTDGCGATLASGNMLIKMIKGKTLKQVSNLDSKQLLDALNGLPKEHTHCALLAINTFHEAFKNYEKKKKTRKIL
jgi:nitrogen fixation NifU-like protein